MVNNALHVVLTTFCKVITNWVATTHYNNNVTFQIFIKLKDHLYRPLFATLIK